MTLLNSNQSQPNMVRSLETELLTRMEQEVSRLSTTTPAEWLEDKFYIPETLDHPIYQGKINLIPYQKDVLNEAFRKDENGLYVYSLIVWSDIKKSAKSTIAAGAGLYIADTVPWAENYFIANDLKQADTRVGKYARRAIQLSPYLNSRFKTRGYQIAHLVNGSVAESVPIDPEGEAGSNADFIQFSELWGAMDDAKSRMFTEMTLSPTKFGKSMRWIESYAGYKDESEILYNLWEMGVQQGELLWPDRLYPVTNGEPTPLEVYVNEDARMLCLWNTQPRCPWQTPEYYKSESSVLFPAEFERMHRNQWISNTDTFVPIEWWEACERETLPEIPYNHPHIISMDAAVSDDTFGVILLCRHPDRDNFPNDIVVRRAKCWKPGFRQKIDFSEVEGVVREWVDELNIVEIAYDEYQLYDMASRLYKEGLAYFRRFPQGGGKHSRLVADSALRDKIRDRRIWYHGLPDLYDHLQNADAKIDNEDRKVRIVKRTQKLKIDLAVALSMASYEAFRLNI